MRHLKSGRKLKRTSSHRKALLRNMATSLFEHKKVFTTEAKAKELRPYAEALITKAKHALVNEKQGLLPEGQKVDIHNRRVVARHIFSKAVLQELFDTIAPLVEDRPGGYTRIIKTGFRRGDAGRTAVIELVDWSAPQDGAVSKRSKRKATAKSKPGKDVKSTPKEKTVQPVIVPDAPIVDEVIDIVEPIVEAPIVVIEEPIADVIAEPVVEVVEETTADIVHDAIVQEEVADEAKSDESTEDTAEKA